MATIVDPKTGAVQPSFVPVAKHYGVSAIACPPRRGSRKGSVEKSVHFATQRFWRTMTAETMDRAQARLDRFSDKIADRRPWRGSRRPGTEEAPSIRCAPLARRGQPLHRW